MNSEVQRPKVLNSEVLSIERQGHVATLWLDRAEARNAMGPDFWADLPVAMKELSDDGETRAVVIAARGPHFSVGLDLKAMASLLLGGDDRGATEGERAHPSKAAQAVGARGQVARMQASISSVAECAKPVIAAVHGYCIGGGVDLITACDVRVASREATFSVREVKMAIVADLGSLQRLPRIVGAGHVAELAYTGKDITAERAAQIGLVNEVLQSPEETLEYARTIAAQVASNSPLAVQGTKAVLTAGDGQTVQEGLDFVAVWNSGFLQSDDLKEAVSAFLEKREPKFTGN